MKLLILASLLLISLESFAFKATSGVQLCGREATLYSFYEGGHPQLHNVPLWKEESRLTTADYLNRALAHLKKDSPGIYPYVSDQLHLLLRNLKGSFVPKLPPSERQTDVVFLEEGCDYVTIAGWNSDDELLIDEKLYVLLSPMNQAGLLYQEAHSSFARKIDESINPDTLRLWVAKIFSDEYIGYRPLSSDLTPEEKRVASSHYCRSALEQLAKQVPQFVKITAYCAENGKTPRGQKLFQDISSLMRDTIDNCYNRCHWDKAHVTCKQYEAFLDEKSKACD